MTSVYGYSTPGDMSVFYPPTIPVERSIEGTILDYLYKDQNTQVFSYIVEKANMQDSLAHINFDSTLIVPLDKYLSRKYEEDYFVNMSTYDAYRIVNYSILQSDISFPLLQSVYYSALVPKKSYDRIESYTINGVVTLNDNITVLPMDVKCNNGRLLFIDDLLIPYNK